MNYKAHSIGGLSFGLSFAITTLPEENKFIYISVITASALLGSLLPDIDEPNSFIGKKVKPLSKMIKFTAGHRGIFHSLAILIIFPIIYFFTKDYEFFLINSWIPYQNIISGLMIGYTSHLLMDSMTEMGVPLFWPISRKKISIMKLKTNKHEWIAITMFIVITLFIIGLKLKNPILY